MQSTGHAAWQTARTRPAYDVLAPDGSEIRELVRVSGGSLVHCTLQPGQVTQAVRHRSVEELWYCVAGRGELWRRGSSAEEAVQLEPGTAVSIPLGVAFQFRASGSDPLEIVITTLPPWPGPDEAIAVEGYWQPSI